MVAMYLSVGSWSKRGQGSQLTPIFLESMVRGINQALLDADQRVESISRMTGTGYQSLYHKTSELCQDLATLNSYVTGLPADLDTQLDHPLFERFANGPTGALADIKMDDITTDNLPGLQTQRTIQGDTITFTADQISFDDIIGVGDTTDGIPHFKDFFNQARIAWAAHQGPDGHDMSLDDYINALLTSGEYDHKGHHPVQDFITGLLDFTIVWALYKSMTGYDPITGETLSEIERLLGLGMALVDAIALAIAIPSGMGSLAGAAALKAALHIGARELIINALATGFAMATFELVTALGLPDWVAALAGLGAGILITTIGTTIIIKWGNRTYHFDTNGNQIPNHETNTPDPGTPDTPEPGNPSSTSSTNPDTTTHIDTHPDNGHIHTKTNTDTSTTTIADSSTPTGTLPNADPHTPSIARGPDIGNIDTGRVEGRIESPLENDVRIETDSDPHRLYTLADGTEYKAQHAPELLPSSRITDEFLATQGITRQELIELINTPIGDLTASQKAHLIAIRQAIPSPTGSTVFQKVLGPAFFDEEGDLIFGVADGYIQGTAINQSTIGGSMTVVDDTSHLINPEDIRTHLRLDYPNSPFPINDSSQLVMRFTTPDFDRIVPSFSPEMGGSIPRLANYDDPFTGNGFIKVGDDIIPESMPDISVPFENGEIWEILDTGTQRLVAVFDQDMKTWITVKGSP